MKRITLYLTSESVLPRVEIGIGVVVCTYSLALIVWAVVDHFAR